MWFSVREKTGKEVTAPLKKDQPCLGGSGRVEAGEIISRTSSPGNQGCTARKDKERAR